MPNSSAAAVPEFAGGEIKSSEVSAGDYPGHLVPVLLLVLDMPEPFEEED